jgi:hypothetical protein
LFFAGLTKFKRSTFTGLALPVYRYKGERFWRACITIMHHGCFVKARDARCNHNLQSKFLKSHHFLLKKQIDGWIAPIEVIYHKELVVE